MWFVDARHLAMGIQRERRGDEEGYCRLDVPDVTILTDSRVVIFPGNLIFEETSVKIRID